MADAQKAWLILSDGTVMEGLSMGICGTTIGEMVFTTNMIGYQETLTDPTYYGQIVAQTFPLIGNYGVNEQDSVSEKATARGYVAREWCGTPSNFRSIGTIDEFLKKQEIVGIYNIDTRALTRRLRKAGTVNAMITTDPFDKEEVLKQLSDYKIENAVEVLSIKEPEIYEAENERRKVVMIDCGGDRVTRQALLDRDCTVIVVPYTYTAEQIESYSPDGILISDGPGDPAVETELVHRIRSIASLRIPIFAIALGHQLLALAMGAATEKMPMGHRGASQPVRDLANDRIIITVQNHGYTVNMDTMAPETGRVSHVNVNDGTCEGIEYCAIPAFSVQFSPMTVSVKKKNENFYDRFIQLIEDMREVF